MTTLDDLLAIARALPTDPAFTDKDWLASVPMSELHDFERESVREHLLTLPVAAQTVTAEGIPVRFDLAAEMDDFVHWQQVRDLSWAAVLHAALLTPGARLQVDLPGYPYNRATVTRLGVSGVVALHLRPS
jgi:hypothetical protein